ncbi:unnamed protein product [Cylicostephanus goldi]|uniref:Uncharacterized protein n=1 Tax=Cylicostephanus goldi TaxID=71465 RepID=A0A3P6TP75_CYLGO|nr:unnamed protein product [Cylicostephanus goldi]
MCPSEFYHPGITWPGYQYGQQYPFATGPYAQHMMDIPGLTGLIQVLKLTKADLADIKNIEGPYAQRMMDVPGLTGLKQIELVKIGLAVDKKGLMWGF